MDYQTKAIAYIDILGFKNYIESTRNEPKKDALYKALVSFKPSEQAHPLKYPSREASHFSDLLVISVDYEASYINQLIIDLLTLTQKIIDSASLLLRGIIIKGDILHYNGIIFGPGLIEAYEKEREIVRYPRIVVDESIMSTIKVDTKNLFQDIDGMHFIDYISPNIDLTASKKGADFGGFKDNILGNLIKAGLNSDDRRVKEKYQWIVEKHNQVVEYYYQMRKSDAEESYKLNNQALEKILAKKI